MVYYRVQQTMAWSCVLPSSWSTGLPQPGHILPTSSLINNHAVLIGSTARLNSLNIGYIDIVMAPAVHSLYLSTLLADSHYILLLLILVILIVYQELSPACQTHST